MIQKTGEIALAFITAGIASFALTAAVRKFAVSRSILDHPSERSSHVNPTPRGGGLAICAAVLSYVLIAAVLDQGGHETWIALGGAGLAVAMVGWLDDLTPLGATTRLAVHGAAAIWAISWLGGFSAVVTGNAALHLGMLGPPLAVLGLVWSTNLFNFMDGIDGIAAVEGISVAGFGGLLLLSRNEVSLGTLSLVIAGACLGFLWLNWAPAKIFMGDVGSGFLGFMLATVALASEAGGHVPLLIWAILAAVFIVDATITIARRFRHGHWRDAHRSHAYQRLTQAGWTHARVSSAVGLINMGLAGIAWWALQDRTMLIPAVLIAFSLVSVAYVGVELIRPFPVPQSEHRAHPVNPPAPGPNAQ